MKRIIGSLLLALLIGSIQAHPLRLSICNIDVTENSIQIAVQLNQHQLNYLVHGNEHETKERGIDSYLKHLPLLLNYIENNLSLELNAKSLTLHYSGNEEINKHLWLKFTIEINEDISVLALSNTLFTKEFPQQRNIVMLTSNNKEMGFEMDATNTHQIILENND